MDSPLDFRRWQSSIKAANARPSKAKIDVRVASFELSRNRSYCLEFNQQRADMIVQVSRIGQHRFPASPEIVDVRQLIQCPA